MNSTRIIYKLDPPYEGPAIDIDVPSAWIRIEGGSMILSLRTVETPATLETFLRWHREQEDIAALDALNYTHPIPAEDTAERKRKEAEHNAELEAALYAIDPALAPATGTIDEAEIVATLTALRKTHAPPTPTEMAEIDRELAALGITTAPAPDGEDDK